MIKETVIKKARACRIQAKLTQPFRIAIGQHNILDNVLFAVELRDGTRGYGEAAVATHITGETVADTLRHLNEIAIRILGEDASDYLRIAGEFGAGLAANPCARAAFETALLDALTRQWKIPLWKFFGAKCRLIKTDMTIVIGSVDEADKAVRQIYMQGIRAFKIKIGKNSDEDFERVLKVYRVARGCPIYLDANQAFSAEEALRFLKRLRTVGVLPALIEQPVAKDDWEGLEKVTRDGKITVLADESVSGLADAVKIIKRKAANAINIKLMKYGVFQAREIASLALAAGLKLMIGSMMETELAATAAAHMASANPGFDFIDLDTPFFIRDKVTEGSYLSRAGVYDLRRVPAGIGVMPAAL